MMVTGAWLFFLPRAPPAPLSQATAAVFACAALVHASASDGGGGGSASISAAEGDDDAPTAKPTMERPGQREVASALPPPSSIDVPATALAAETPAEAAGKRGPVLDGELPGARLPAAHTARGGVATPTPPPPPLSVGVVAFGARAGDPSGERLE